MNGRANRRVVGQQAQHVVDLQSNDGSTRNVRVTTSSISFHPSLIDGLQRRDGWVGRTSPKLGLSVALLGLPPVLAICRPHRK
jgi:hypothetical protein